ncbi:MAG: tetratricopeptide repeat protein [Magnetococcales bacterium]|nr:tetratricopeptide repeat protein [Magnetococcales bacterium]
MTTPHHDALACYQARQYAKAISLAEAGLANDPSNANLLTLLAVCRMESDQPEAAIVTLRQLLGIHPDPAEIHHRIAGLLHDLHRQEEAEAAYRIALTLRPEHADARFNLSNLLTQQGREAEAEAELRQLLRFFPQDAEAWCHLGNLLAKRQGIAEAEAAYREGLRIRPGHVATCNNLGNLLVDARRFVEAETAYRLALAGQPGHAGILGNLGVVLKKMGRFEEAEGVYREALQIRPDHDDALLNLGMLLIAMHRYPEAEALLANAMTRETARAGALRGLGDLHRRMGDPARAATACRESLRLEPDHPDTWNNLGNCLADEKRWSEAEACFREALRLRPECPDIRCNLGHLLLTLGRFDEGWPLYEARHHPARAEASADPADCDVPFWQGEALTGRSIRVLAEQGFGDQIQFGRYAPLLKAMGARRVTLVCEPALRELLAWLDGVDRVLVKGEPTDEPVADLQTFPLSIPRHLGTIAPPLPALRVAEERIAHWRKRLPGAPFRVGLAWRGNPNFHGDRARSLPGLATLAPLWSVPGIAFVSLQKGAGAQEARFPPADQPLLNAGDLVEDFAQTAAIVAQLDLVICSDSAVAHLTGALARPCWVMLAWNADWRWGREGSATPWYPEGMRLYRQSEPGNWHEVIMRIVNDLKSFTNP